MIGNYVNGVLTIREGITHLEKNSISGIDGLRKIIFPSTLTSIEEETICNQDDLEILDFSRVTKLEEIPEYMVCYGGESIRRFVIPQGVKIVNDSFLCSASLEELYVPSSMFMALIQISDSILLWIQTSMCFPRTFFITRAFLKIWIVLMISL